MQIYYVNTNAQQNGDHEVHRAGCPFLPVATSTRYVGDFRNCYAAVQEARKYYPQSNGCSHCSRECHTG